MTNLVKLVTALVGALAVVAPAQELYRLPSGHAPRWHSFENATGAAGAAAKTNLGAKGSAWEPIKAGTSKVLLDRKGSGTVRRIWLTLRPFDPAMLRSLVIEMYWDGAAKPAVSAPVGDFFAQGLSVPRPGESELFSNPEGRSLNCYIPMPFRTGARIVVKNQSKRDVGLFFYEIDVTAERSQPADMGYFHAFYRRVAHTELGKDYVVLPKIRGKGRYLGATIGVQGDPQYGDSGWGEGEVHIYLDGDGKFPTLSGTGTEDYIGTGWGMGPFSGRYQGCTVSDPVQHCWAFYRFHIPDPVFFDRECKVTLQDIGGDSTENLRKLVTAGAHLRPVSAAVGERLVRLLTDKSFPSLFSPKFPPDAWVNFYRSDDYSSVAYYYLDRPSDDTPPIPPASLRTLNLRPIK